VALFRRQQVGFSRPGSRGSLRRQSLIDPFFEALGWDIRNASMTAPQDREVVPEDSLEVEGQQRAPDYAFRVGAQAKFYAEAKKRGSKEVDSEFLKEIESWRDTLARNIALRNPGLSLDDLNIAIQLTIDRIVFLRMAEDRGIEPTGQLLTLCERPGIYPRFMLDLCRKADEKSNSGLFHFQKETGVPEAPDRITPSPALDDEVIKPVDGLPERHQIQDAREIID
jgi:hypothetical protein